MSELVIGYDIYGDPIIEHTKICNKCGLDLPLSMFNRDGGGSKLRSWCKHCDRENNRQRAEARKNADPAAHDHECPICKRNEATILASIRVALNKDKKLSAWCFDHDSETGIFRGWICAKCNLALGNFDHDIDRMMNAVHYMMQFLPDEQKINYEHLLSR